MDHAVSPVQAYLQLNGYFTSAEYMIIASAGRNGERRAEGDQPGEGPRRPLQQRPLHQPRFRKRGNR